VTVRDATCTLAVRDVEGSQLGKFLQAGQIAGFEGIVQVIREEDN
jgi:hypothetical protein